MLEKHLTKVNDPLIESIANEESKRIETYSSVQQTLEDVCFKLKIDLNKLGKFREDVV